MARDLMAKRPAEIDLLIGEAPELGRAHGVDLPVCQFVYHMVKTPGHWRKEYDETACIGIPVQ